MGKLIDKTTRLNLLFDFYQALLTPKQQEYMDMYYIEDFSLVEIADLMNVSRQAVYDNIKRTEKVLESYESKLFLYKKFEIRHTLLLELKEEFTKSEIENKTITRLVNSLIDLS